MSVHSIPLFFALRAVKREFKRVRFEQSEFAVSFTLTLLQFTGVILSDQYKSMIFYCQPELIKGAVSRNSAKLGNYKMPVKLRET